MVYIVAVENGLLPHDRSSNDDAQLEEERRLAFVGITRAEQQLQLSYTLYRDFRGQRRRSIPSLFLLEMPRDEMELVQLSSSVDAWESSPWEENWDDTLDPTDELDFQQQAEVRNGESDWSETPAQITTAAELTGAKVSAAGDVSPEVFAQGMAVIHPEHGLGKIVALSGSGKNRRATVRFATAGEKRFVLAHSPLRPAGR